MLPDWADPDTIRTLILVAIGVILYAMYTVACFVRRTAIKLVLFLALAGLGLSLWVQRTDLDDCARTCDCTLYGQEVNIPRERLAANQCT